MVLHHVDNQTFYYLLQTPATMPESMDFFSQKVDTSTQAELDIMISY